MSLNPKALWMAVSWGNIPCRLRLQMIADLWNSPLWSKVVGRWGSSKSFSLAIHFVGWTLVPEPSAKFPISHSSCIPANTSNQHPPPPVPPGPKVSQPSRKPSRLLPERFSVVLPGWQHRTWDAVGECPQRGYSTVTSATGMSPSQCHDQQGDEIKDEPCLKNSGIMGKAGKAAYWWSQQLWRHMQDWAAQTRKPLK